MPYEVKSRGKKWVVQKKVGDHKVMGTHPTRAAAVRQLRALYANERTKGTK